MSAGGTGLQPRRAARHPADRLRPVDRPRGQAGWRCRSSAAPRRTTWITALKGPQVKKLAKTGTLQPSLFDEVNLAQITSDQFPGERLVVCRNPLIAAERTRKREELLAATEAELAPIRARVKRGTLTDAGGIGLAVGPAVKRFRMKKHFDIDIADGHFAYRRNSGPDRRRTGARRHLRPAHQPDRRAP